MPLELKMTEKFDGQTIRTDLGKHLEVDEPKFMSLHTTDPPSILQILGDVASWFPLIAPATVYLSTLAKRAGNATWDRLASLFENNEVRPLADVVKTLRKAADNVDGKVVIFVGLNIPDSRFGTAIPIKPDDPEEKTTLEAGFIRRPCRTTIESDAGRGRSRTNATNSSNH